MVTVIPRLFSTVAELKAASFTLDAVPARKEPSALLMCEPTYFDIIDAKNPFMTNSIGACDTALAKRQWADLRATIEKLGYKVNVLPAVEGLEDMVFAANQVLPGEHEDGARYVILANMMHASRRREIPHYAAWFEKNCYDLLRVSDADDGPRFEGQGDAIWHPAKKLLWGAYGHRTERSAYKRVAELTGADVLLLELVNEKLYHLDTAFAALDTETVLIAPEAFSADSLALIRSVFKRVLEIPAGESGNFAGNALTLGKHVILQRGSTGTCQLLRDSGFIPVEVDTSEFMKSGGSVFCMKMIVY